MPYFERKEKMRLYEQKLAERKTNEEVLKTKKGVSPFKVGDMVNYNNDEYEVKFCDKGNCVIEKDGQQQFIECSDAKLVKSSALDENNKNETIYKVEAYNKDADTYTEYLSTTDYDEAVGRAKGLDKLCIVDKLIDTDGEPFDWVQITVNDTPVWVGGKHSDTLGNADSDGLREVFEELSVIDDTSVINEVPETLDTVATIKTNIPSAGELGIESAIRTNAIDLLKETLSLVDKINTAIINFADVGADKSVVDVLTSVLAEQNVCVGKLYELVKIVNPQSALTEIGEKTVEIEEK